MPLPPVGIGDVIREQALHGRRGSSRCSSSMPDVITSLEAIRDRHRADPVRILNEKPACEGCLQWWPCPDRNDAEATLMILTACTRAWRDTASGKEWFLLVPIDAPADDRPAAGQSPE